jgi:5-formyltetrahydrofolate cyclo-ligase
LTKSEIRKHIKDLINENISTLANQSQGTCRKIVGSEEYSAASEVFAYMALPDEVDLSEVIKQALKDGKKVALPKILSQDEGIMEFFYLDPQKTLSEQTGDGAYGILEPDETLPAAPDPALRTLILVPGRAFTKDGERLGRGKGYYDRYLKKRLPNVTVAGVCFSFQVLPEVPTDLNDVKMDVVFTISQE